MVVESVLGVVVDEGVFHAKIQGGEVLWVVGDKCKVSVGFDDEDVLVWEGKSDDNRRGDVNKVGGVMEDTLAALFNRHVDSRGVTNPKGYTASRDV